VTLDFEPGATLLLATQNMNGIEIGDGTVATRNRTFGHVINRPSFNPLAGIAPFTSGACIHRNFVAFCHVNYLTVYGRDGGIIKLSNGVYDYRATECDTPKAIINTFGAMPSIARATAPLPVEPSIAITTICERPTLARAFLSTLVAQASARTGPQSME
jgi:hypothetical protein